MIIPDVKKSVTILMSRRSPKGENLSGPAPMKSEKVMNEDREEDGRHVASSDVLAAIHEKSPQRLMEALANFVDLHGTQTQVPEKE